MSDRLGVIEEMAEVDGGLVMTIRFDSIEAEEKARLVLDNLARLFWEELDEDDQS